MNVLSRHNLTPTTLIHSTFNRVNKKYYLQITFTTLHHNYTMWWWCAMVAPFSQTVCARAYFPANGLVRAIPRLTFNNAIYSLLLWLLYLTSAIQCCEKCILSICLRPKRNHTSDNWKSFLIWVYYAFKNNTKFGSWRNKTRSRLKGFSSISPTCQVTKTDSVDPKYVSSID